MLGDVRAPNAPQWVQNQMGSAKAGGARGRSTFVAVVTFSSLDYLFTCATRSCSCSSHLTRSLFLFSTSSSQRPAASPPLIR